MFSFFGFSQREAIRGATRSYQRWTSTTNAIVRVAAPPDTKCEVRMRLLSQCPPELEPTNAFVRVAGRKVPLVFTNGEWKGTQVVTPNTGDGEGFTIEVNSRTWKPADYPPSRDSRTLGLLLQHVDVRLLP